MGGGGEDGKGLLAELLPTVAKHRFLTCMIR